MKKSLVEIGAKIKALREKSGFTQKNIAEFLEIDQSLVSKFESGERAISVDMLEKLASLFGCNLSFFMEKADFPQPMTFAFRASEISVKDMKTISMINRIALNSDFMAKLLERNCKS